MNETNILLDTNICIYILGKSDYYINSIINRNIYLSFITKIELLSYPHITTKDELIIKKFLMKCRIVNIDEKIIENAILIRKGYGIKLPDSIIIATSLSLGILLFSNDKKLVKITNYMKKNR